MKTKRVFRQQLIALLLVANCLGILTTLGVIALHRSANSQVMRETVDEILAMAERDGQSYADATAAFIEKHEWSGFDVSCLDEHGAVIFSSSEFRSGAALDKKTLSGIEAGGTLVAKGVRIHRPPRGGFLVFDFVFPPPPPDLFLTVFGRGITSTQSQIFWGLLLIINTIIIASHFASRVLVGRLVRHQVLQAEDLFRNIESGARGVRLDLTGIRQIDPLVESFNHMVGSLERNLIDLDDKDQELRNLIQETSHDFKTPLTGIYATVQNLIDYPDRHSPEQSSRNLNTIKSEIGYMTRLVESLLFISTIALQDEANDRVDLSELIAYECETIASRGLDVSFGGIDSMRVNANEILLRRMVKNLLDNAIKNAESEVLVTLARDGESIRISVANDGNAVADKSRYGVKRTHRTVDQKKGIHISMGLGSIIIRKISEKYHGRVIIEDRNGGGAVISVIINAGSPKREPVQSEAAQRTADLPQ